MHIQSGELSQGDQWRIDKEKYSKKTRKNSNNGTEDQITNNEEVTD